MEFLFLGFVRRSGGVEKRANQIKEVWVLSQHVRQLKVELCVNLKIRWSAKLKNMHT